METNNIIETLTADLDKYMAKVICSNCLNERYYKLPKGERVEKYLEDEICINCNCKIITTRKSVRF